MWSGHVIGGVFANELVIRAGITSLRFFVFVFCLYLLFVIVFLFVCFCLLFYYYYYYYFIIIAVTAPENWSKGKLLGSGAFGQVRIKSEEE